MVRGTAKALIHLPTVTSTQVNGRTVATLGQRSNVKNGKNIGEQKSNVQRKKNV